MKAKRYRGYYIDGVIFNSKADIDKFIEQKAVESFVTACEIFNRLVTAEASIICHQRAENLVKNFGYTWDAIEAIENKVAESVA